MEDNPQTRAYSQQGSVYVFANVYMYEEKPGVAGRFKKFKRSHRQGCLGYPGSLSELERRSRHRRRPLAFYGSLGGDFRAVDRDTGKILWHRKLASGIIGNPITYKVAGKQYVSVWTGIGGWIGLPVTAGLDHER